MFSDTFVKYNYMTFRGQQKCSPLNCEYETQCCILCSLGIFSQTTRPRSSNNQSLERSFIHYRTKQAPKYMDPRLNIIQIIIIRSFIQYQTKYSSFFYPLPSLKIGGELSGANCSWRELSDIRPLQDFTDIKFVAINIFYPSGERYSEGYASNPSYVKHSPDQGIEVVYQNRVTYNL